MIKELEVNQGDLVFIRHREKPFKTGWYRKLRIESVNDKNKKQTTTNSTVCYVLEIPTHKDYDKNRDDKSRTEAGLYTMSISSVRYEQENKPVNSGKYEVMCVIKGAYSSSLSNYLNKQKRSLMELPHLKNMEQQGFAIYTLDFRVMVENYKVNNYTNEYIKLTQELI